MKDYLNLYSIIQLLKEFDYDKNDYETCKNFIKFITEYLIRLETKQKETLEYFKELIEIED